MTPTRRIALFSKEFYGIVQRDASAVECSPLQVRLLPSAKTPAPLCPPNGDVRINSARHTEDDDPHRSITTNKRIWTRIAVPTAFKDQLRQRRSIHQQGNNLLNFPRLPPVVAV